MGWGDCGTDSQGRPIGYSFEATCDHPGCEKEIDRGLSYVCGDMHGDDEYSCEKYFCEEHRQNPLQTDDDRLISICDECKRIILKDNDDWWEHPTEGVLMEKPMKKPSVTITAVAGHGMKAGDLVYLSGLRKHWFKRLILWLAFWYNPKPVAYKVESINPQSFTIKGDE